MRSMAFSATAQISSDAREFILPATCSISQGARPRPLAASARDFLNARAWARLHQDSPP